MKNPLRRKIERFRRSGRALAIPATFLILFFSTLTIVSITYYYAIEKIEARSQSLKVSLAKQNMISLDKNLLSVLWQPGSSETLEVDNNGGELNVQPLANQLMINITDGNTISETIFNESIGQVIYEFPYSESSDTGVFLKGDSRVIVSESGSAISQLCVQNGAEHIEILVRYRPFVSSTTSGTEDGKTVNNIRLYVMNLNSSQSIELAGEIPLKISCARTDTILSTYDVSYQPETLILNAVLDGVHGQVIVPISSTTSGAMINVELVVCSVKIEKWLR